MLLISRDAEVDKADFHGRTPLSWVAEYGQLDCSLVNINTEDREWTTACGWVIHTGTGDKIDDVLVFSTLGSVPNSGAMEHAGVQTKG